MENCTYCHGADKPRTSLIGSAEESMTPANNKDVWIGPDGKLKLFVYSLHGDTIKEEKKINFCPMCGREL